MTQVQDYDSSSYDYRSYWSGRSYEHLSEVAFLKKLISPDDFSFLDIGGGYGRLSSLYKNFKFPILLDYSIKNLKNADKDLIRVCADVYNLPFKDGSIRHAMSVRLMHHIENPSDALREISRVINGDLILEFANKDHFIAKIKHMFDHDFKNNDVYFQKHKRDSQGWKDSQIFINFRYAYIISILKKSGFIIKNSFSISNFRNGYAKKIFNTKFLVSLDRTFQPLFKKSLFGPSIFVHAVKKNITNKEVFINIDDIFCCPKCKGNLNKLFCHNCGITYKKIRGIYNFKG